MGANRAYLDDRLPHISELLTDDADAVLAHAEVCVVGSRDPQVVAAVDGMGAHQFLVDLVRLPDADARRDDPAYTGIAW
jgi:GDP-mannose 6-dehydrogenase